LALSKAGQALEAAHGVLRLAHGGSGEATATVRILYESTLALIHESWSAFLALRASPDPAVREVVEAHVQAMRATAQDAARVRETVPPGDPSDAPPRGDEEDRR
jgi:hypothetical protein